MLGIRLSPIFLFCAAAWAQLEPGVVPLTVPAAEEALEDIFGFLQREMLVGETGAVRVNAVNDRPAVAGEARNGDCLSEAAGQMMEFALVRGDREEFARQFRLVRDVFQGKFSPFLAWKVSPPGMTKADTSATLDDWRVVWACLEAARRWDVPEYREFGIMLAAAIVEKSRGFALPPPAFNLGDGSPGGGMVPLCYLHLPAMMAINKNVPGAGELLHRAKEVLLGPEFFPGMIPQFWDPETGKYSEGPSDEVTTLITLLSLQAAGMDPERVREAIGTRLGYFQAHGRLPQTFLPASGEALPVPAGASVYALFARLLLGSGDREAAAVMLAKMLEFRQRRGTEFAGAIGGRPVFSFDQLEALLALAEFLKSAPEPSPNPSPGA